MIYQQAYKAYQQRQYDKCLRLLQEIKENNTEKLDLLAQVYFQNKEFQKAYDIYHDLIEKGGALTEERKENVQTLIVCAQLQQPDTLKLKGKDFLPNEEAIIDQVQLISLKDDTVPDITVKPHKRNKRKKKRKVRLPKSYDPESGPDPERWLPRRDRKGNVQKRKKKRQVRRR